MGPWAEAEIDLLEQSGADLARVGRITPRLAAFASSSPVLCAAVRPFVPGEAVEAFLEVLALALPLGANRFAVAVGGRAWSLDDPIPPVTDGVDLRARVLVIHLVDGQGAAIADRSVLRAYTREGPGWRWGEPTSLDGGSGPLGDLVRAAVDGGQALWHGVRSPSIVAQARRCGKRGHEVRFAEAALSRVPGLAAVGRATSD